MSDVFDRIAASTPQNATAARVTAKGEHYDPKINFDTHDHWDAPPKMLPFSAVDKLHGTLPNLAGHKVGRVTAVGVYADPKNTSRGLRWVVRCVCGDYELRSTKALRNPVNTDDECRKCYHWKVTKKRLERLGSRSIDEIISSSK